MSWERKKLVVEYRLKTVSLLGFLDKYSEEPKTSLNHSASVKKKHGCKKTMDLNVVLFHFV